MYTLQDAFDKMVRHLLSQGKRSYGNIPDEADHPGTEGCLYRGPDGLMCAVGCLISDEDYDPRMENSTPLMPSMEMWMAANFAEDIRERAESVLSWVQDIHDNIEPEGWEDALRKAAGLYDLSMPKAV